MNTEDSEFARIEREQAMRGVPDAIHHTDTSESLEYITGWNDCRQAMLADQPAPVQKEQVVEIISKLEPLLAAKNQSWAQAEKMLFDLLATLQPAQQEPVSHAILAGALFDFMGWLTSRKERLVLSSADGASPAADAIRDFAKMRGLSLDDPKVQDWHTTPQAPKETT